LIFRCISFNQKFEIVQTRVPFKKPAEDDRSCAFELLASLAGELLKENESSASSNASEIKPLTEERFRNGSGEEKSSEKHLEIAETDCILERISANNNVKSEIFKLENKFGNHSDTNRFIEVPNNPEDAGSSFEQLSVDDKFSLKDPLKLGVNSPSLVDFNSNAKSPFCGELFPNASFSRHGKDIKLGFIDDDEKFLRCNKVCTKSKAFRPSRCIARKIIRKRLTSKHWKVAPKLKDYEHSRYGKVFNKYFAITFSLSFIYYAYLLGCFSFWTTLSCSTISAVLIVPFTRGCFFYTL
jgi:hypothetical protein